MALHTKKHGLKTVKHQSSHSSSAKVVKHKDPKKTKTVALVTDKVNSQSKEF